MVKFMWRPEPLESIDIYDDGLRWGLYVVGQRSPGYPKYLGRVCRNISTDAWFVVDMPLSTYFSSMGEAAKALQEYWSAELVKE